MIVSKMLLDTLLVGFEIFCVAHLQIPQAINYFFFLANY